MNQTTISLILALLPLAERLIMDIGGKLVEVSTANLTDTDDIVKAIETAKAEGFPDLKFVSATVTTR